MTVNTVMLFILLTLIAVSVLVKLRVDIAEEACRYIEDECPDEWHTYHEQALTLGVGNKWIRGLVLESIKNGKLADSEDPMLLDFKARLEKNASYLVVSPFICSALTWLYTWVLPY